MKTKNIFRMLLVAAALLLGANNVKASESLPYNNSNGENRVEIVFEAFKNASSSDILRITYKVTEFGNEYYTPSYAITIGNNSGGSPIVKDLKPNVANNQTSIDVALSEFSSVINTTDGNNCSIYVQGSALAITGIVLVTSGNTPITTYTVTVNTGSNGSASANPTSTTAGQIVTITTDPDNGYEVDAVTVANVTVTKVSENTYTFPMPGNDVIVNVTFKAKSQQQATTYSITINSMQNGTVTASKTSSIAANEEITLTITPDNGYQLGSIAVKDANNTNVNLSGTGNTRTFSMPASNVIVSATFTMQSTGDVTAYIGSTGKATFSYNEPLNFAGVTGMKAYIATTVSGNQVTLTQVTGTVAAGTGLVIISDNGGSGSFDIPSVATGDSYTNNLLVAGNDQTLTLSNSYTDYVLIADTDGLAVFAEVWSSDHLPTIESGKAYLHVPTSANARTRSLSIVISNGTTGISSVEKEQGENLIYNLRGQRVENPTKGLYIINGKKVLIK